MANVCRYGVSHVAARTKQRIQKGFKISDLVTKKLCKCYHKKHEKKRPKSFPMKLLIAPCIINYSNGLSKAQEESKFMSTTKAYSDIEYFQ